MELLILLIILIGVIPNILKKQVLNNLTVTEYFISFSICMSILTLGLFLYKTYIQKEKIELSNVFGSSVLPLFILIVLMKFFSIYKKLEFLKTMHISTYYPTFKSLSIVLTMLLGIIFLNEKKSVKEWIGAILIVIGVFILNGISTKQSGSS